MCFAPKNANNDDSLVHRSGKSLTPFQGERLYRRLGCPFNGNLVPSFVGRVFPFGLNGSKSDPCRLVYAFRLFHRFS